MENPIPLVIFQLNRRMEVKTRHSIPKSMATEQIIPAADTLTGLQNTIEYRNHGKGSPTVMSNMFDPTEDETAMSPNPLRATITLVIKSGIEVPAAKNVSPITSGGMPKVSPVRVAHHTIKYEKAAIHSMLPVKVTGKNFLA